MELFNSSSLLDKVCNKTLG